MALGIVLWGIRAEVTVYLEIDSPKLRLYRLAFLPVVPGDDLSKRAESLMERCLEISHLFEFMDRSKFPLIREPLSPERIDYKLWREMGAEFVLSTAISHEGGQLQLVLFFYDPVQGIPLISKVYRAQQGFLRQLVYKAVDDILQTLTGREGLFNSRIAFIRAQKEGFRELWLIRPDGGEEIPLVKGTICMSPSWSHDGRKVLYTSLRSRNPDLYVVDIFDGTVKLLSQNPGPNVSASWSPDGRWIALAMRGEKPGDTDLYLMSADGGSLKPLLVSPHVEVSPCWSPDGKRIAFVSDRTGTPQIYIYDLGSGKFSRLTNFGSYNAWPSWSPKGDWIAFSGRWQGQFKLFIIRPDGSDLRMITPYAGDHERPSWAPNGRHLVFSSNLKGKRLLYITTIQSGGPWVVTLSQGEDSQPAWSRLYQ